MAVTRRSICALALIAAAGLAAVTAPALADNITISGKVQYTGRTGAAAAAGAYGKFGVRGAKVYLIDRNIAIPDTIIAEGYLNDAGEYTFTVSSDDDEIGKGFIDPFIRVEASTRPQGAAVKAAFTINKPGVIAGNAEAVGAVYDADSDFVNEASGNTAINFDLDQTKVAHQAFAAFDAFTTASRFYAGLPGVAANTVPTTFPTATATSSYFDGKMRVLGGDRYDWDVIAHEYGHYIQSRHGLLNTPGGDHSLDKNLRFSRGTGGSDLAGGAAALNRRSADRLAFNEGSATWLSMVAQQVTNTSARGVQRAGDLLWNDNDDADGIGGGAGVYSVESRTTPAFASLGEDNEVAVTRILYDLFDATNEAADRDRVTMSHTSLFKLMDDNDTNTLSDFWAALSTAPGTTNARRIDYGAIFQAHNVAPAPDEVHQGKFYTPDTIGQLFFSWAVPTGGQGPAFDTQLLHDFKVLIFDDLYNEVMDSGWLGNPPDGFYLSQAQQDLLLGAQGLYRWIVVGREVTTENNEGGVGTFGYTTGGYWSDQLLFRTVPTPTTLALLGLAGLAARRRR